MFTSPLGPWNRSWPGGKSFHSPNTGGGGGASHPPNFHQFTKDAEKNFLARTMHFVTDPPPGKKQPATFFQLGGGTVLKQLAAYLSETG